ncbi:MAG: hypothetical protein U0K19_03585 [Bifidobacteriaceae bacterium]|nr:hypothetical protein [Bifidobacteriaceae bacterium]
MADEASATPWKHQNRRCLRRDADCSSLRPLITLMSVPVIITNVIGVVYNLTDTFYADNLGRKNHE